MRAWAAASWALGCALALLGCGDPSLGDVWDGGDGSEVDGALDTVAQGLSCAGCPGNNGCSMLVGGNNVCPTDQFGRAQCFCDPDPADLSATIRAGGREGALPASLAGAGENSHWVGVLIHGPSTCPAASASVMGAWTVSTPFSNQSDYHRVLQRFCTYTWVPAVAGNAPDLNALPAASSGDRLMRLERDIEGMALMGQAVPPSAVAGALETAYLRQLGQPTWSGVATGGSRSTAKARVEAIDTAEGHLAFEGAENIFYADRAGHATAVGSIIDALLCGHSAATPWQADHCAAQVGNYSAARVASHETIVGAAAHQSNACTPLGGCFGTGGIARTSGGELGRLQDVGDAIVAAVNDWIAVRATVPRLVLNLSIGWDPLYGGPTPDQMRAVATSAYFAINYAACQGAIVVAAAGNRAVGSETGPTAPAAWEGQRAKCDAWWPQAPAAADYAPMVYSVGAVDGMDQPFLLGRTNGVPRLVAPGVGAAVTDHTAVGNIVGYTIPSTPILSGTSIAAAAVSGIAGTVAGLRPDLLPWQIMAAVYSSGTDLARPANYDLFLNGAAHWNQRRVSLCGAIMNVCVNGGQNCPSAAERATIQQGCARAAGTSASPNFVTMAQGWYPELVGKATTALAAMAAPPAEGSTPTVKYPYAIPQPSTILCPGCAVTLATALVQGKLTTDAALLSYWKTATVTAKWVDAFGVAKADTTFDATAQMLAVSGTAYTAFKISLTAPAGGRLTGVTITAATNDGKVSSSVGLK